MSKPHLFLQLQSCNPNFAKNLTAKYRKETVLSGGDEDRFNPEGIPVQELREAALETSLEVDGLCSRRFSQVLLNAARKLGYNPILFWNGPADILRELVRTQDLGFVGAIGHEHPTANGAYQPGESESEGYAERFFKSFCELYNVDIQNSVAVFSNTMSYAAPPSLFKHTLCLNPSSGLHNKNANNSMHNPARGFPLVLETEEGRVSVDRYDRRFEMNTRYYMRVGTTFADVLPEQLGMALDADLKAHSALLL